MNLGIYKKGKEKGVFPNLVVSYRTVIIVKCVVNTSHMPLKTSSILAEYSHQNMAVFTKKLSKYLTNNIQILIQ